MKKIHYDRKYFEDRDRLDLHIVESIKILMQDNNLKRVLDVGCGTGKIVQFFNQQGFNAIGCDKSKIAIEVAKKVSKKSFIVASATKLPFKTGSFDLVISISTIEHLIQDDVRQFLQEACRVLKPHGFIFMITPNYASPLRYLLGKKWFGYSDPTHITFFTPKMLSTRLVQSGFKNIKLRLKTAYNVPSNLHLPGFLRQLPMPIKNALNYLMISSPLSTLRDSFWIAAQKNE